MKSVKKTLKKYFIPHAENDHKPFFLREAAVSVTAAIVVILFFASIFGNYVVKNNEYLASVQAAFLVDLTNEDREDNNLPKLAINDKLINAASLKAGDMSSKSYFAHVSPEGRTPWYWIDQAGYPYLYAGENLAVNFYDSEDVEQAWMDSPTHKANIMSKNFTEIGIATARGKYKGENTTFVVQMFGSPKKTKTVTNVAMVDSLGTQVALVTETPNETPNSGNNEDSDVLGSEIEPVLPTQESPVSAAVADTKPVPAPVAEEKTPESFMTFTNPEAEPVELEQASAVIPAEVPTYTNWFERVIVNPVRTVDGLYSVIAAVVIFALILKIFIEIRLQHPRNIAYGVLLLAIIVICMHINGSILAEPTLVVSF